jgi:hypothetical protein
MPTRFFVPVLLAIVFLGCAKKEEPVVTVAVEGSAIYKDPILHLEVAYPKNWPKAVEPGKRVIFYSSNEATYRYTPPFNEGVRGVKIEAGGMRGGKPEMEKAIAELKSEYSFAKFDADQAGSLGTGQGTMVSYSIDGGDGIMHARRTYAVSDSFVTYLETAYYDNGEAAALPAFEMALKGIVIAHGVTAEQAAAAMQDASGTMEKFSNEFFTVEFPNNFTAHSSKGTGMMTTVQLRGERNDCSMQIDVFEAKKLTVDKVFDQNKAKYPNAGGSGNGTIDANPALYLNYSPMANVSSRVYFMVKNDKVYRVILNWYKPQQQGFLPVFENCVATLKAK